ncbi:MAG: response regulator transcription factor, partial [Dehalococcoidia bacterium]|nr:response regulator transcription factor [Dehalococcoidia bacterium]
ADCHRIVAQALAEALSLEPDLRVVAFVTSGDDLVREALRLRPDVVIVDQLLPDIDGVAVTRRLRELLPSARVIVLSAQSAVPATGDAVEAGVDRVIPKSATLRDVVAAVRAAPVADPSAAADPSGPAAPSSSDQPGASGASLGRARLTEREYQVLREMATGADNDTIAQRLVISPHTIRTHVQNIMHKLHAHSKLEVVTTALRLGLIDLPPR